VHLISQPPKTDLPLPPDHLHIIPFSPLLGKRFLSLLLRAFKVRNLIERISPDILHAIGANNYGVWGSIAKANAFIVWAIGSDVLRTPFIRKDKTLKENLLAPFWRPIIFMVLQKASAIYTESISSAKFIAKMFGIPTCKITAFPWGVDVGIFSNTPKEEIDRWRQLLKISPEQFVIIAPRTLRPLYNPETIIYSIPAVKKRVPNVVYIFLRGHGESSYLEKMKELSRSLSIENNIRFVDKLLQPNEVSALLHLSQILISIPPSDAFPITVLEGLLCGCIPIVSDIPANRELASMGATTFFVTGYDPNELAEVTIEIINRWNEMEKFIDENKEWVLNNATQEVSIAKMEALYKKVLERRDTDG